MKTKYILVGAIIVSVMVIGYLGYSLSTLSSTIKQSKAQKEVVNDNSNYSDLKISSIKIRNLVDHTLTDITAASNVAIKKGEPVLLHVNFTNPNQNSVEYFTMIKVDEKKNGTGEQVASTMIGKIGDNGTVAMETLWKPTQVGDYTLTIITQKKSDMNKTPVFGIGARADVAIRVVE
jgi:hypothetical protein